MLDALELFLASPFFTFWTILQTCFHQIQANLKLDKSLVLVPETKIDILPNTTIGDLCPSNVFRIKTKDSFVLQAQEYRALAYKSMFGSNLDPKSNFNFPLLADWNDPIFYKPKEKPPQPIVSTSFMQIEKSIFDFDSSEEIDF